MLFTSDTAGIFDKLQREQTIRVAPKAIFGHGGYRQPVRISTDFAGRD